MLYSSKTHDSHTLPQKIKNSSLEQLKQLGKTCQKFFCPFKKLKEFIQLRGDFTEDDENFFIFRDGSNVAHGHVHKTLRAALESLRLDSKNYNTHSLRLGRTVDMLKYSYSIDQIKLAGR